MSPAREVMAQRGPVRSAGKLLVPALWVALALATTLVAAALAGALRGAPLPTLVGVGLTRTAADVAGVACVGLALVVILMPAAGREVDRVRRTADRALVAAGGAWVAMALLGTAFRAAAGVGAPVTALTTANLLSWTAALAAGRGAVLAAACALVVLGCAIARLRDPDRVPVRVVLVVALLGLLTPAVTGHAGSAPGHEVAVTTVALHVAAASLWVGGLAASLTLLGGRPALLRAVLPRFSTLAGACLAVVTVSGVLTAQVRLGSWAELVATGYGALLIAKVAALALLGGFGLVMRRRLATGKAPALRWALLETALMAVALGLAAALSQTAP